MIDPSDGGSVVNGCGTAQMKSLNKEVFLPLGTRLIQRSLEGFYVFVGTPSSSGSLLALASGSH